jgi:serine/threonine-protein kinase RsbT
MATAPAEVMPVRTDHDIVRVRQKVREYALVQGFSVVDQTKIVTAASEIARNTVTYGGGGEMLLETVQAASRRGLRLTFTDKGPGIADIEQALGDGFSTSRSLGLGLGGAKRLVNYFEIDSKPGAGTQVRLTRWR